MRDEEDFLAMLDSALRIQRYVQGISHQEFLSNEVLEDAILWRLMIIGEAGKKVSATVRQTLPQIPFDNITRMRDRLAHVYWRIDYDIVWDTVTTGIPDLVKHLIARKPHAPPPTGSSTP